MMSLKQSDVVAMGSIAAGVVFPFALLGAYNAVQARSAETEWSLHAEAAEQCEVEVVEAEPTGVIVVLRRDREPMTVVGHKVTVTDISSDVEMDANAEAERMGLLEEELRALERRIQMERTTDVNGVEARAAERYQVVMEQLRETLKAEAPQASADDQQKKRRRKKRRRPC
jgi:hypothetical protein